MSGFSIIGLLIIGLALLATGSSHVCMASPAKVTTVELPRRAGANRHYVSNRAPLLPGPLVKLPIGSIIPKGWLRRQLELLADGMMGHLPELSEYCRIEGNAWISPSGEGHHPWEEVPYWLRGFGDLGYVLQDERITREARRWIDGILSTQRPDGYFGPEDNRRKRDLWPNMTILNTLQAFYEATGDARVLPFMTRYFRWQMSLPKENLLPDCDDPYGKSWQKIRAGDNLESIYWLYNRTGEAWLLTAAKLIHERASRWDRGVADWHGVNICQGFREPATFYLQSKNRDDFDASERDYQVVMMLYGQVPGGMFGADENCRPGHHGPRQGAEACSMVEVMHSDQMLLGISGDPVYADRCEDVAFNSLPAAMTADYKGLHYITSPNQPQMDQRSKSPGVENGGVMMPYSPHLYRCCQHNVVMGWPYYAEHLWMATLDQGLAAVLYVENSVKAKVADGIEVTIAESTDYPFDEAVEFTLSTPQAVSFPLYLRVPGWCQGATLAINGVKVDAAPRPSSYLRIERAWSDGDKVRLELPMRIGVTAWPTNARSVSVRRGPLWYSLKIGEEYRRFGGTEKWPEFEVLPTTPWNYGLVLDDRDPASSFQVARRVKKPAPQPFTVDAAPIELSAQGRRIPNWKLDHMGLVAPLQESPVKSDQPVEKLTLIPLGCARLRVSSFPVIGESPDAHEWTELPPPRHEASYHHDEPDAVSDGIVPRDSCDRAIPRLTWWPHTGTVEWLTYKLDRPRKVSSCEVYWFGRRDEGIYRPPAAWKLYFRLGEGWREVSGASAYGAELDKFNRVTFTPVETREMKIEVTLPKEHTSGILEWRIE